MTTNLRAATTITPKVLAAARPSTTSATVIYTVPANTTAKVSQGTIANITGSAVDVTLTITPSGGSARTVIHQLAVAAHDTQPLTDLLAGAMLGPGDVITVTVGTGSALDVLISGTESA